MTETVWVLTRDRGEGASVYAVYATRDGLLARIERIRKANSQYPFRELGPYVWVAGPEEDEGFFGHKPVFLRAVEMAVSPAADPAETATVWPPAQRDGS